MRYLHGLVLGALLGCGDAGASGGATSSTSEASTGAGGQGAGGQGAGGQGAASISTGGSGAAGGASGGGGEGATGAGGGGANFNCGPSEGEIPTLALEAIAGPVDLLAPSFVLSAPGDDTRLFLVSLYGKVHVLDRTTGLVNPTPFLDLTGLVATGGERGLLGLAFHPDYAENGRFFVHYSQFSGGHTSVEEWARATPDTANQNGSTAVVLTQTQPFTNHNGGTIAFGADGLFYIFLGDGGSGGDPMNYAQNLGVRLGKVLRYDVDAAPGIAMAGGYPGALDDVWAIGVRNPWRASFDFCTGDLYFGDVGQNLWEEVDWAPPGASGLDFGWRDLEGTHCYLVNDCNQTGKTMPIFEYDHAGASASVAGGFVYRGNAIPGLRGRYIFADTYQNKVWSFRNEAGVATDVIEHADLEQGLTIVSFGYDNDGELYVTDLSSIYKIIPAP